MASETVGASKREIEFEAGRDATRQFNGNHASAASPRRELPMR